MVAALNGLCPGTENEYVSGAVVPVLRSLDKIQIWAQLAHRVERELPAIVHIDTGMNRLGLGRQARVLATMLPGMPSAQVGLPLRASGTQMAGRAACLISGMRSSTVLLCR
jgi:alanine racemase